MRKAIVFLLIAVVFLPITSFAQEESKKSETKTPGFLKDISFEEGTFLGDANKKVVEVFGKVEAWREKQKESFKASLDKVESKRSAEKDPKPAVKALTIAHICVLAVLLFIFSIQIAFYIALALIVIGIVKKIIGLIARLFRRRPETA